jgi:hypothetical protein
MTEHAHERYAETFPRVDGKFGWRARSKQNGQVTAVDGSQGFDERNDAAEAVRREYPGIEVREADE